MQQPSRQITDDEVSAFQENGAVCLRGLFDGGWLERLRDAVDERIAKPGVMRREFGKDGKPGRFYDDTFIWTTSSNSTFRDFAFDSPAAGIAARLMRSLRINLLFDQFLIKEPGASERTPWHHDIPYWPVSGEQVCSLWFALDPVNADNGAVEYVKGSHRWGKRFLAQSFFGDSRYAEDLPKIPDIESMRGELEFLQWEMEPGDCLVHHGLTVHGAPGNSTQGVRRRGYITRWCGDDVRYQPRPNIQPMLRDPGISPGAPLDCDLFPRVLNRGSRTEGRA